MRIAHQSLRALIALAAVGALAACADSPTVPTRTMPAIIRAGSADIGDTGPLGQAINGGELWVCKEGVGGSGTFHFTIDYTEHLKGSGPVPPQGSLTEGDIATGSCLLVSKTATENPADDAYLARVTEAAVPSSPSGTWSLTSITSQQSLGSATIDLVGGIASGLRFGNDGGAVVTFKNVLTAGQGCSPGYYKKHTGPDETKTFAQVGITGAGSSANTTLKASLAFSGGPTLQDKKNVLLRQAAAAYFNSIRFPGAYPLTTAQVIAQVSAALNSGNATTITDFATLLDGYNNIEGPGC